MGLSISVYQNVEKRLKNEDFCFTAYVIDEDWNYKIKNLENGSDYIGDLQEVSISYPYSSHNRFREFLVKMIGRTDLIDGNDRIDWYKLDKEKDMPFYEFINFADNEGCIDWETNSVIYENFKEYEDRAVLFFDQINVYGYKEKYLEWMKAFRLGSENKGVVVFW